MASTVFNGTNLLLKLGSSNSNEAIIGHTTSASMSISVDLPEATTKDSNGFQEVIAGLKSAEISFDGLVDYTDSQNVAELNTFLLARTEIFFEFGTAASGDQLITGSGFLSSIETTAEMESPVSFSGSLTVNGAVTLATN